MRRLALAAACAQLALAVFAASVLAAAPTLTPAGGLGFPNRQFVLSLPPGSGFDPSRIDVRENGRPVDALSVLPAGAAGSRQLGVVLVIDTSRSMKGDAIAGAMAATRAFASHRNPQQQLGVVTFNGTASTLLPLTTDQAAIDKALAGTPALGPNTHIYDATEAAISLLKAAHISAGSVVVLSDGSDTGSGATNASVVADAKAAGIRIFAVGLRSGAFDPATLSTLAKGGAGSYTEAGSKEELAKIYDELGAELSSQYIVRYRSSAAPHANVHVTASVTGTPLQATAAYNTPALPVNPPPPYHRSFWQSPGAVAAISVLCAGLLGLGLLTVLTSSPAKRSLRARMRDFVSSPGEERGPRERVTSRLFVGAEKTLERRQWWATFKEELDVARIDIPPVRILLGTFTATVFLTWLLWFITGAAVVAVVGLATPLAVRFAIKRKLEHERRLFSDELADNLQVIASAMRAGQSFVGALSVAVQDAPEPARREFERVVADERLGVPLEEGLGVVVRRMANHDLEQVQLVAALQRQTGGNMAEVLDRASDTIRERAELRRMIKTLTAQGRLSRWVVSALPPSMVLILSAINPGYLDPLFKSTGGLTVLVISAGMVVGGSLVIKRIVDIEV
ncbi:MAG TPA: VWA domain-containing protein [Thermoleophilaceae bacterium]